MSTGALNKDRGQRALNEKYEDLNYDDRETQQLIKKVYDLLQDLRRGKVTGYENWVMEV